MSEVLIFASTNPQYDDRLFIELQVQCMKIPSSEHGENTLCTEIVFDTQNNFCTKHVLPMFCKMKSFWQRFTCNQYFVMFLGTYLYSGAFLTLCCKYSCKMHTVDLPAGFSTQSFLDFLTIFCLKGLFWSPLAFGSSCSSSKTGMDIILVPSGNAGRLCLAFSESSPTALDLDFLYSLIVWSRS